MSTDVELARAAQQGDSTSLGLLLERHRHALHALALGIPRQGPDAEDADQETCLIALGSIEHLHRPEAVGPWRRGIARNASRRRITRRGPDVSLADAEYLADPGALMAGAEELIDRRALRDWMWTAFAVPAK